MTREAEYTLQRQHMVEHQLMRRGISDERVLEAMSQIPRHRFLPADQQEHAYTDSPQAIGCRQTISQPYMVALMTQLLAPKPEGTLLEIGTGSGYQAAVLARLGASVHTIERHASLAAHARQTLAALKIANVHVHVGDGSLGLPEYAPYQGIVVTAGAPRVPQALLDQLDTGGCLVIPVGPLGKQILERWERHGAEYRQQTVIPVAFVPLIGEEGWKEQ